MDRLGEIFFGLPSNTDCEQCVPIHFRGYLDCLAGRQRLIYEDGLVCFVIICWSILLRKLWCFVAGTVDPSSVSSSEPLGIGGAV